MTPGYLLNSSLLASPSSRRAWIEILNTGGSPLMSLVALLAEGVDRNRETATAWPTEAGSPSSRRAWIEIAGQGNWHGGKTSRPPRGGRG